MKRISKLLLLTSLAVRTVCAQDTVRYTGSTLSNVDYHHGQLPAAVGVHNTQVLRANRQHPERAGGFDWTYNHAPMLAYWNGTFYLQYLSNPVGEHVGPGRTLLLTSKDGYNWSKPEVIFPVINVPDGWKKDGRPEVANNLPAVMHQRMGFFVSKKKRLLTLAYYGIVMGPKDDPNDGKGIGRVVREIRADGSYGPIYFIRPNKTFAINKTEFPLFTTSSDKGFTEACQELLANPLMMQQWVEEADRDDPLIPLKKELKAFSFYHLADNRVVGLWKNALTSISTDEGKTWQYSPLRAPGFVNSNAKIWGQRTADGRYATVYNPSEFRWPLAISTSDNGLNYKDLLLVNGDITTMRYGGAYKSYGPQYVRGIQEGDGVPPGGNLWVTYSVNKEDIWVAEIPVPVKETVASHPDETFDRLPDGRELAFWNLYSPLEATARIEKRGTKSLVLRDKDPFDYAKAERVVPDSRRLAVEFAVTAEQYNGTLQIEALDARGTAAVRLTLGPDSLLSAKTGYRESRIAGYQAGKEHVIRLELDAGKRMCRVRIDGRDAGLKIFFAPVVSFRRICFRTGPIRRFPDADTPTDQSFDLPDAGRSDAEAVFRISRFKTEPINGL